MKRLLSAALTLVLFAMLSPECPAQMARRFTFGLEWGGELMLMSFHDYNYIGEDGSNISENTLDWKRHELNAFVEAKVGINLIDKLNISILSGIKGMEKRNMLVPLEARLSFFPAGICKDGFLLSGGVGICFGKPQFKIRSNTAIITAGYRHALEGGLALDLFAGLRVSSDHPEIYDEAADRIVPQKDIRKNDAIYGEIIFGIGISF